jgi:aryl-alcohol dehydrogenase-like predicted oxidoreductase/chlorite dismutase
MSQVKAPVHTRFEQPTKASFGIWSGGMFMHYGRNVGEERLKQLVRLAYDSGIRTFVTADVYGEGAADKVLGAALSDFDRSSYCLVGMIGHDFYHGSRQAEKGFPRFTDASLRGPAEYKSYLKMAAEKSLERLATDHFDLLLLHNPDYTGYTSEKVWEGLADLKQRGLTGMLGVAPGPANGFTLDLIGAFERFSELIDWAMIILNPLEPWPGKLVLPAAEKYDVKILTRVVEYGGLFHGQIQPGIRLERTDHRSFRAPGWIEAAQPKIERFREIASRNNMTLLQLAAQWVLAQPAIKSVVPTLIQEAIPDARPIEDQVNDLAGVLKAPPLPQDAIEEINKIGDNKGCMPLKGATTQYLGESQGDQWQITPEQREVAKRWGIVPDRDLYCATDPRDLREIGAPIRGVVQAGNRRLFMQLQAFGKCSDSAAAVAALKKAGIEGVLYEDLNDPSGIAVLTIVERPEDFTGKVRNVYNEEPFRSMVLKPEYTMFGRTYSAGREPELEDTLLRRPRRHALNPKWPWAIWYPLRRKSEFELLTKAEQGKILMEHAMIGRNYGQAGYAHDVRLACFGLDRADNEFVLGIMGPELYALSRLVQDMRHSTQTARYMESLGPFFVGKAIWQSDYAQQGEKES